MLSAVVSDKRKPIGKKALRHCTTAGSTPPHLDHESFAVFCPLALPGSAFYPVLVHRLAASLHASSPHSTKFRFGQSYAQMLVKTLTICFLG